MYTKRLSEKFKELKINDIVTLYNELVKYDTPEEYIVDSIGKKYIHVRDIKYPSRQKLKFDKENGYGEHGICLFPSDLNGFNEYNSIDRIKLRDIFNSKLYDLSLEELNQILTILEKKYE